MTSPLKHRNRYDRRIADFVLCDPSMQVQVQVIIELDDASHKGREVQDASRESLLTTAGYRVLRFSNVPNLDELKTRIDPLFLPAPRLSSPNSGKPSVAAWPTSISCRLVADSTR